MDDLVTKLQHWYGKLKELPEGVHLLCPKVSSDDDEDYTCLDHATSALTLEEKEARIKEGENRIETTYWNSLILGFSKNDSGKWQDDFTSRLDSCLKACDACVLNWHFKRKQYLTQFAAHWDDEAIESFGGLLSSLDMRRLDVALTWAQSTIETVEAEGKPFHKKHFGSEIGAVHLAIYEALCFLPFLSDATRLKQFTFVFERLQGKKGLKLHSKTPLPGMTHFLFDFQSPERREWALANWEAGVQGGDMTAAHFDWAVSSALVKAIHVISPQDPGQLHFSDLQAVVQFWESTVQVLKAMDNGLIRSRVHNLEVQEGDPSLYDLFFRHMAFCPAESVLVACIRVLTTLLTRSPMALWDFVGQAKPSVITDAVFNSPAYTMLLRQSLEPCWSDVPNEKGQTSDSAGQAPFPISWVRPWLESFSLDQRYEACDHFMWTAFGDYSKKDKLGDIGQATVFRAGFDVLQLTLQSFIDHENLPSAETLRFFANSTIRLVSQHERTFSANIQTSKLTQPNKDLKVRESALGALQAALKLDVKLFAAEHLAIMDGKVVKDITDRQSEKLWQIALDTYDHCHDQVDLAARFLALLEPVVGIELVRASKKEGTLQPHQKDFNAAWTVTAEGLTKLMTRVSDLDGVTELNILLDDSHIARVITALSLQGDTDIAEASCDILKSWTCQLSRSSAYEQMTQEHPLATLGALVWYLDLLMSRGVAIPWTPIRPLVSMGLDVLRGLTDSSTGILRQDKGADSQVTSALLRWWRAEWIFVSKACRMIERWSHYISNATMTDFCREIMEFAEALITEDGLITSTMARALGKDNSAAMRITLKPPKDNFRGMDNMIRLRDTYLVGVTVKVLVKILSRLRDNDLQIGNDERNFLIAATVPGPDRKYAKPTNLTDPQRAELLSALGLSEDEISMEEVEVVKIQPKSSTTLGKDAKTQSRLDAWSKSGSSTPTSTSSSKAARTNRDDVNDLSKSLQNPLLKALQAQKPKAKPLVPDKKPQLSIKEQREREKAEKKARDAAAIARAREIRGETNPGEGSGLQSLGILGKDHGKSEIMVNSSDEESDDDGDSDAEDQLATITGSGQKTLTEAERKLRREMLDKQRRPVKKERRQRTTKDLRARIQPSMDKLHAIVLQWNLFHNGEDPPSGPASTQVDSKYSSASEYQKKFLPLLTSEAWRGLVSAKDETTSQSFALKVVSRATVDSFLEVSFSMPPAQYRDKDKGVREGDILLISEAEQPLAAGPQAKSCLARIHRTKFKKDAFEITYRINPSGNAIASNMNPGIGFFGLKITNMATVEREYATLASLQFYDLCDEILQAEPSPVLKYGDERIAQGQSTWGLNRAQALAVLGAQDNDGFTLIQGPPGTGKTKTIVAMVGNLLSDQLKNAEKATAVPIRASAQAQAPRPQNKKLLVCAPSNAAVDELVLRLKQGVKTSSGQVKKINVLRLGRSEAMNAAVKDVSLDELVRLKLEGDTTREDAKEKREQLHEKAGKIKEQLDGLRARREKAKDLVDQTEFNQLNRQFDKLKHDQREIGKQIDASKDSANSVGREVEIKRKTVQQEILNSAQVLCATLSGSGHEMFSKIEVEFETVIIDEAAQCVELSALIPLKYGCLKCILVGDPKQLPPTVLNQSAAKFGYAQSLFVRMQQNHPKSVHLLDTQYRMHPEISAFPSREFYESQLQDGTRMASLRTQDWHRSSLLGPYRFFDVKGVQDRGFKGQSLVNYKEIDVAVQMYERFRQDFGSKMDLSGKIGIITPYKGQLRELRNRFERQYGEGISRFIEFNTTDAFQGRECEIIIFSCVRASQTGGIGFMTDIRRMNVGLTRARSSLWVLGDSRALSQGVFWNKLIEDARKRDRYTDGDVLGMFRNPLALSAAPVPEADAPQDTDVTMTGVSPIAPSSGIGDLPAHVQPNQPQQPHGSASDAAKLAPETSAPSKPNADRQKEGRKRPLDGDSQGPKKIKKITNMKPPGVNAMSKFGGGKAPPKAIPKGPSDPSAEAALGMTPPERPSAGPLPSRPSPHSDTARSEGQDQGHRAPKPPKPRGPPPRGPRAKGKTNMFISRKR